MNKLTELDDIQGKRKLVSDIGEWGEEEAVFKGKDLWIRAVKAWCEGGEIWHDDRTVIDAGDLTTIGEN